MVVVLFVVMVMLLLMVLVVVMMLQTVQKACRDRHAMLLAYVRGVLAVSSSPGSSSIAYLCSGASGIELQQVCKMHDAVELKDSSSPKWVMVTRMIIAGLWLAVAWSAKSYQDQAVQDRMQPSMSEYYCSPQ